VITLRDLGPTLLARLREPLTRGALMATSAAGIRRLPVSLLDGRTRVNDHPVRMLVAGDERHLRFLLESLFARPPGHRRLGALPVWRLNDLVEAHGTVVDLALIRCDRWSARRWLRDSRFLAVPEWIGTRIPVPADLDPLLRSGGSIKRDMSLVRRYGFEPSLQSDREAFRFFYHRVYRPYAQARYGDDLYVRTESDLSRRLRRGGILWIRERDRRVAGALYERNGDELVLLALGTLDGDFSLVQRGAIAAIYLFTLQRAQAMGCAAIDLRGCRPSLLDGVLTYKQKWGATICEKPETYYDLLLRWERPTPAVVEFFARNPLIFRHDDGFSALTGAPTERAQSLRMSGIESIYCLTDSGRVRLADA
jgi:hypothetical protein